MSIEPEMVHELIAQARSVEKFKHLQVALVELVKAAKGMNEGIYYEFGSEDEEGAAAVEAAELALAQFEDDK